MDIGWLSLIDKNISSLLEVPLKPNITSVNLHYNRLTKIEGLTTAWHIKHLDLSSNYITRIEGLGSLSSLHTLNLSCNSITKVEGLTGLVNLTRLSLAYNQINDLSGLLYLHGTDYKLKYLELHRNRLDNTNHVLQCLAGLCSLTEVTLCVDSADNPVCSLPGYREVILQSLPQVSILDGEDRLGNPALSWDDNPTDVPGLDDFLEFLVSTDTSDKELVHPHAPLTTPRKGPTRPRIDKVQTQYRQRSRTLATPGDIPEKHLSQPDLPSGVQTNELCIKTMEQQTPDGDGLNVNSAQRSTVRKTKRDTDQTSESECDSRKENQRHSRIPCPRITAGKKPVKDSKGKRSESETDARKRQSSKVTPVSQRRAAVQRPQRTETGSPAKRDVRAGQSNPDKSYHRTDEETYRTIVEERDQERERRWKAELAVKKLIEQVKDLQTRISEEKELQSMSSHTTDRMKDLLLKERSERTALQTRVEELEARSRANVEELREARVQEDQHKSALHTLEERICQEEAFRTKQQSEEMKRKQELEKKCAVLKREVEIHRVSVRQHKDKLTQLQELLASREEAHRKELSSRTVPGIAEFQESVKREVAAVEQRHAEKRTEMEQKLADAQRAYSALEDEFRMALTIEAKRFSEVKEGFEHTSAELSKVKAALSESQQREKHSGSLVRELTDMVKEQKTCITKLLKSKHDAVTELKTQVRMLEAGADDDRRLNVQLELLKKEKSKLLSQLTAQESVIEGLRAERRLWGQELAQQGASLAQDRGRLEAKIEVLTTELETQKRQNEKDNDALKIKAKIVDDQTETIRKLKEALQERDEQLRLLREDGQLAQRRFQKQLDEEASSASELRDEVEKLNVRKEELKQQLLDKETEMDDLKEAYSASSQKWQEKADLLTRLENQVKRMKEGFDAKEKALLEERNKASQAHKAAIEKLHCVDDAFRRQLESMQASHQAELLRLANDKQKKIEQANQRVVRVEDEMRQLLEETENNKRAMEEKRRWLSSVLKDF